MSAPHQGRAGLRRIGQWSMLLVSSALMLAVWVLLVWVGSRPALRTLVDMSPQQRGTIDPVTIELLDQMADGEVKIEFHCFFAQPAEVDNDADRQLQSIQARLRDLTQTLLRQYEFHGKDAVRVFYHNIYGTDQRSKEIVEGFGGVDPDTVVVTVKQPGAGQQFRKLSLMGDLGVIEWPELQRDTQMPVRMRVPVLKDYKGEGALSSALKGLLVQGVPTIYISEGTSRGLDLNGTSGSGYSRLLTSLDQQGFRYLRLDFSRSPVVPEDADMVMVLEPRAEFSSTEVRALHDYLKRGGRVFLNYNWSAVDGWNPEGGELGKLLGFSVGSERIMHTMRAGRTGRGVAGDPAVTKIDVGVNPNHQITRRISLGGQILQLADARPLEKRNDAPQGVRFDPLLVTGPEGWLARPAPNGDYDYNPPRVANPFRQFTVGAEIEIDSETEGADAGRVVIVTGLFANNVGMPVNGNGALAGNIANWLTERRELLDIRGQKYEARHVQMDLRQFENIYFLLVVYVPSGLLLLGIVVFWRRRRHGLSQKAAVAAEIRS